MFRESGNEAGDATFIDLARSRGNCNRAMRGAVAGGGESDRDDRAAMVSGNLCRTGALQQYEPDLFAASCGRVVSDGAGCAGACDRKQSQPGDRAVLSADG